MASLTHLGTQQMTVLLLFAPFQPTNWGLPRNDSCSTGAWMLSATPRVPRSARPGRMWGQMRRQAVVGAGAAIGILFSESNGMEGARFWVVEMCKTQGTPPVKRGGACPIFRNGDTSPRRTCGFQSLQETVQEPRSYFLNWGMAGKNGTLTPQTSLLEGFRHGICIPQRP